MSCGHMEGVRAEKGPPGVGTKSDPVKRVVDPTTNPSLSEHTSSSSSDKVSAETQEY